VRDVKLPKRSLEAFGSATLTVSVSSSSGWPHLVAVLSALTPGGGETVISEGGVPTSGLTGKSTRVTIRLLDAATLIPSGSRLRLTLASSSTAQDIANALYLDVGMVPSAKLTVTKATLRLPVLQNPVSRRKESR
jgi:predicted acyl esterase